MLAHLLITGPCLSAWISIRIDFSRLFHLQRCHRVWSTNLCLYKLRKSITSCKARSSVGLRMSTVNQHNRVGEVYGSVTTLIIITTIAVILRLLARKISAAPFWWDDWTIISALVKLSGGPSNRMHTDDLSRSRFLASTVVFWFRSAIMISDAIQYLWLDP